MSATNTDKKLGDLKHETVPDETGHQQPQDPKNQYSTDQRHEEKHQEKKHEPKQEPAKG
jgi:hypothetical protein